MRNIFAASILLLILLCAGTAQAQEKREWKFCEQASDCVVVGGGCCLSAVYKDFTEQGKAYCDDMNARIECIRYMDPAKSVAKCEQTPVPCMGNPTESCLSKRKKCVVQEQEFTE